MLALLMSMPAVLLVSVPLVAVLLVAVLLVPVLVSTSVVVPPVGLKHPTKRRQIGSRLMGAILPQDHATPSVW